MRWGAFIGELIMAILKGLFGTDKPMDLEVDRVEDVERARRPDADLDRELGLGRTKDKG